MHWLALAALAACDSGSEPPRPAAIAVSPASAKLSSLGETATFTAKITDENGDAYAGTVTWSSSDAAVFTVTAQGAATSVGNGSGTLTASFEDLSATASVVVEQVPVAITLTPDFALLSSLGETATFTAKITDANGSEVPGTLAWSSSDPDVFTVDTDGLATSVGNGSGTLTASFEDLSATASVVVEQVPVAITLTPDFALLSSLGETAAFTGVIADANGSEVPGTLAWSSNDPDVFTVDTDGLVTAVANGTAALTSSSGNLTAQAPVVVEQVAVAIAVAPDSARLTSLGDTVAFAATITDALGSEVPGTALWSSSDTNVFTVDAQGVVTAVGNGTETLTASFDSLSSGMPVVVEQVPAALLVVSGDEQEGTTGTPLEDSLAVRVDDAGGSPIEGVPVGFEPADGHGSTDPATADTDADGLSRTVWTLGPDSGVQRLTAWLARDMSVEFTASARPPEPRPDSALYRIEFEATWSDSTHPDDFPANAHFSPLIGGVHNDSVRFWELGDTASPGMEDMAETGRTRILEGEIRDEMPDNALAVVEGSGTRSPGSSEIDTVVVNTEYPLVMLVTMIAPSPDWFAGVTGLALLDEDGEWVEELEVLLYPLDAGTDSGGTYTSPNQDTSPQEPIKSLRGQYPFSDEPVGTYVFTLIEKSGGG